MCVCVAMVSVCNCVCGYMFECVTECEAIGVSLMLCVLRYITVDVVRLCEYGIFRNELVIENSVFCNISL